MSYKEIKLPAGIFRMYDDRPFVWVEVPQNDGFANWGARGAALIAKNEK